MSVRGLSLGLALGVSTCLVTPAFATLQIQVFDDGVQVGSTVVSATGSIGFIGSDANFSDIQVSAQGDPLLPSPDLSSTTIEASAALGFIGSHVLEVDVLQTGLSFAGGLMQVTGTVNGLVGSPGPTTENTIVNGVVVDTELFPASALAAAFGPNPVTVGAVTSDQQQYITTFTAPTQSSSASMQFIGVTEVHEPNMSLLFMAGLGLVTLWGTRKMYLS
jgi:hypothetical protein